MHTKEQNQAQIVLPSKDLTADMDFLTKLGFRLNHIFPADDPAVAIMSGHGLNLRLDKGVNTSPATIHILTDYPEQFQGEKNEWKAPNGTIVKILPKTFQFERPITQHKFEVRQLRDGEPWVIGRAGMLYRDLIPDRLGGSIIASHIRIPNGGPVPDMVHYHTIGFQLIYCYKGWVRLVYEDQGPPFILQAGDCVTQPPEIRHQVLEASDNLEVIEIGVPAAHMTTIDHDLELPTPHFRPERKFHGQRFCYHQRSKADWKPWHVEGFENQNTAILEATQGVASVQLIRAVNEVNSPLTINHKNDILFTFVLKGKVDLWVKGHGTTTLKEGDAFVIPPNLDYQLCGYSEDLELLEVGC